MVTHICYIHWWRKVQMKFRVYSYDKIISPCIAQSYTGNI